ncbi:MAG: four helix bundle protein [Candidatus Doudnabacteria bacterium]|nr:four helix bundle protein [Candidatus Doudnabacteria bacterium]
MSEKVKSYRDLIVWQKATELVMAVYRLTSKFPNAELYGLVSQMRRCAVSIPSNIAEGRTRGSRKDFRQFLITAISSGAELETQLVISSELRLGKKEDYGKVEILLDEIMRMLNKMIDTLSNQL